MAKTNIYDFSSYLGGAARPSQFRVHINFPSGLVDNGSEAKRAATFLTHQARIPNYRTEDTLIHYRGRQFHEAGEPQFEPWSCSVYNGADFKVREALEQWTNAVNAPDVVYGMTRPESYKSTIFVEQLDREGNTLRVYKLVGAWPSDTGEIELSYQNANEAEQFQVTFVYDYFVVGGTELLESAS